MNELFDVTFTAIVVGFTATVYWLIKIRSQDASTGSLLILWGAFILLQILGFMATFTVLSQSLIAFLFIFFFYKLGLVIRKKDRQRQKEHLRPLRLDVS